MRRFSPDVAGSRFTMRRFRQQEFMKLAALAVALLGGGSSPAAAETVRHSVRFDASTVRLLDQDGATAIHMGKAARTWDAGRPELPYVTVTLLVPRATQVIGLRARATGEALVGEGLRLANAVPLVAEDGSLRLPTPERTHAAVAASMPHARAESYPALRAELAGDGALHGYRFVSVRVHPIRWEAATGRAWMAEQVDLELELAPSDALPIERQRWRPELEAAARASLEKRVANPAALDGYDRRIGALVERPPGFQPTDAPSLEGSDVDYIIITNAALAASYQVLADWKTRRGIPAVVRTTEWIQANYRQGCDLQETIRTFIQDAYSKWGVQYVVLGGDTDILPARYGYSLFGPETEREIPSDLYFGCLDGNWNADGDGLFGEAAVEMGPAGDSPDFYPEVLVGRIPFSSASKVATFTTKLIAYENPALTNYQDDILLLGEVLFPVAWTSGNPVSLDGASICEEASEAAADGCVTMQKLYENNTAYPGTSLLTRSATLAAMNAGPGFVNHVGHGYRYNMSCGDLSLQNSHALALTNSTKRFLLYMLNCTATAFDFPCLGESYLESPGGAIGVLGSSRAAYALPARPYNVNFFTAMYQDGLSSLGAIFAESHLPMTDNTLYDTADHYTHLLYNLLGDPEMPVHRCALGTTAVTHPSSISIGLSNVILTVNVNGTPTPGVRVCVQKGTEEYESGLTGGSGTVTLPILAETTGSILVTASGPNMTTYLGTITVNAATGSYVATTAVTVDDNNSGNSNGNSDGVLDAGETLELAVTFRNNGSFSASNPTGRLRIPSPWATVIDSTYNFSSLGAGNSTTSTNQVYFSVAANAPDGTVLPLRFVTTSGLNTWNDTVLRVVHAPRMALVLHDVDDFAPGGNADGVIQAGETFDLVTTFKNYGTGAADGLTATLATSDPDVVLTNGSVSIGRANPIQQVTGATRFRLRENVLAENLLTVTLTDNRGRTQITPITLRGATAPPPPVLDASSGATIIVSTWTPNLEPDLAGYHLYRATQAGGPWTRATVDRTVRIAYFRDVGLAPSTRYYYYATAVDSSGNESSPSPVSSISTNPNQLNNWPIELASSSSCPLAVGDITGDGSKEIVAGNSHLYAWNASGTELRDDDNDPQTWGVFATEVNTITGGVALGEVDRTIPGFEIFVSSWDDTNKVFVFRGDGSIQPGWPQNPDPTSVQKGYWANVTAVDVDGDTRVELFAAAKNGNLYAWHWNGTPLGVNPAFKTNLGTYSRSAPSIANLDADPALEIVYGSPQGTLHIWNSDGTNYGSFPKTPGAVCLSNTAIGDVNDDTRMDVVMITENGAVNVYNTKTGFQLAGWPQPVNVVSDPKTPSPALADFEFDGKLEIVVALNYSGQSTVRIFDFQGNVRPGWPKTIPGTSESSPIVADFSGDGVPDVLFGGEGGLLYAWDKNGVEIAGFPLSVGDFIRSVPFADDVDGDGGIDLVLSGWDKNVYIWDFPIPYVKAAAQWPTLSHDSQRSGFYEHHITSPTDVAPEPEATPAAPPVRAYLAQNHPNPFNPTTSIAYGVAGELPAPVHLDVYDASGRHVRRLVDGTQPAGHHRAIWDGRDTHGAGARSGVYFVRLRIAGEVFTRKMLLLK